MPTATTSIELPPVNRSGQWNGFLNSASPPQRRRLDLLLQFHAHQLSGVGDDEGDMFVLRGEYDSGTQEFRWVQTYVSGVALFYRGFCDAATLWGTWHDTAERHGGFRIWPLAVAAASPTGRATDCSRAGSSNSRQSG